MLVKGHKESLIQIVPKKQCLNSAEMLHRGSVLGLPH